MTGRARTALVAFLATISLTVATAVPAGAAPVPPRLPLRAAILYAPATGQVLYGVDANARLAVASATKLMTALVTLEHARLSDVFAEPSFYFSPADSQIGLVPGERMTVHDLMLAMLLPSADDAAENLAYNVGHGSVARFIAMMNAQAQRLGLTETHYTTPVGLDTPGNYSSAFDLARLAAYDLRREPFFARAVALPQTLLRSGDHPRVIINRNDLVGRVPGIDGVKTGHTLQAGYVLVASGVRHGLRLISVVLGTDSETARDDTSLALLNYGWRSFHGTTVVRRGTVVARPPIRDESGRAVVVAQRSVSWVLAAGEQAALRIRLPGQLSGPLARHAVVGSAAVMIGHQVVARIPLVLAAPIPAVSTLTAATRFITRTSTLVVLLVLLAVLGAALAHRRVRFRHPVEEEAERA